VPIFALGGKNGRENQGLSAVHRVSDTPTPGNPAKEGNEMPRPKPREERKKMSRWLRPRRRGKEEDGRDRHKERESGREGKRG